MLVRGLHYINKPIYPSAVSKQELFSGMDSGMAYAIQASMRAAAQLPYNAECGSTYPDEIRRLGCGTCVSKAALAKDVAVQSGMSNVEAVGGYTTAPSMAQIYLTWGGSHAANVVYTPQGMLYMDADRLGPQSDFFPFVAGYDYKVPGLPQAFSKRIFRDLSDRMMGGDFDGVSLFSIPGFGAHGQWMTDLQQQVPSSLQGYAAELWKQRQKLYQ